MSPDARCRGATPTALHLEQLTLSLIDVYDKRDYETPLENFICPTFRPEWTQVPPTAERLQQDKNAKFASHGKDAFIEMMNYMFHEEPYFRMRTVEISASVNESKGTAQVWRVGAVTGIPEGQERETVSRFDWKRQPNGDWICVKHTGMSGVAMSGVTVP